ncbi:hypothetical protein CHLRE_03g165650v5 [Chlamydomonas reinhardtii]|uniref:Trafficking protein particle complex subunit 2-like protein n=1 Tax=Chlamydomonas reinhardtii TaxID=3055 RepID=A8IFE6_CHLRE|nr:uncharacterized protein CHLRE_03g165650v5 [Chlamydomonas reinhardtii]PNW84958.1 hypothetical protein CHLRE_03g165650v5 [Chlamydomonas reinhardtii]|eukprot:XP_001703362.1 predicted protein [Chlamydomonas reinhardtii]
MGIACVAFIGPQNNPMYLRSIDPASDDLYMKLHYVIHCALDAVEEKVLLKRGPGDSQDAYLGLLYPTEDYKVYGYLTNTHVKVLLLLDDEGAVKDEAVMRVFRRLHGLYVDTASNPFHKFGLPLSSPRFDAAVDGVVSIYRGAGASQGGFMT